MRDFVSITQTGMIDVKDLEFYKQYIKQQMPISIASNTWYEALKEMFPDLSGSEITRRIKSGAFKAGPEAFNIDEASEPIGLKSKGAKGFDCQVIAFGKQRGVIVMSEELRNYLRVN